MAYVERDVVISASASDIFNYACNADNLLAWYAGIDGVEADGVWPEVGGQLGLAYKVAGIDIQLTAIVITNNPPLEFAFQMDGMVSGTATWTYTEQDGGTHLSVAFDYDLPGGVLGQVADKLIVEQQNINNGEQSLANLKSIFEGA